MRSKKILIGIIVALIIIAFLSVLALSAPVLITLTNPSSNASTIIVTYQVFNVTTNITSTQVNYTIGFTNGTSTLENTFENSSTTAWGINITYLIPDSLYGKYHNITVYANDSTTGGNRTTSVFNFYIDTASPLVARFSGANGNWTVRNDTRTGYKGNWVNITFNASDILLNTCGARLYNYTNLYASPSEINGSFSTAAAQNRNCTVLINASQITPDGPFIVEYWANDTSNRRTLSGNETGVKMTLKAGKWNLLTYNGPSGIYGLNNITRLFPVNTWTAATFNTSAGFKNYTIYSSATPSINNNTKLVLGDAFWLYNGETYDVGYLEHAYFTSGYVANTLTNRSLISTDVMDWNFHGVFSDTTINATLWSYAKTNGLGESATYQNVTALGFWNQTENDWITCMSGIDSCSGNWSVLNKIPRSYGLIVAVNFNLTLNYSTY